MKAVRRAAPLASPIKSTLLKVMLFMNISPYLFNEVATALASTRADNIMLIVFTNLFFFILFIMYIRSFSNGCLLLSDLIVRDIEESHYRISLQKDYTFVRIKF